MDSGAELVFAKFLDNHDVTWIKNTTTFFLYTFNNKTGKYYPDFFLPDINMWVEIKGKRYIREGDDQRLASVGNIIRIMSTDLKDPNYILSLLVRPN